MPNISLIPSTFPLPECWVSQWANLWIMLVYCNCTILPKFSNETEMKELTTTHGWSTYYRAGLELQHLSMCWLTCSLEYPLREAPHRKQEILSRLWIHCSRVGCFAMELRPRPDGGHATPAFSMPLLASCPSTGTCFSTPKQRSIWSLISSFDRFHNDRLQLKHWIAFLAWCCCNRWQMLPLLLIVDASWLKVCLLQLGCPVVGSTVELFGFTNEVILCCCIPWHSKSKQLASRQQSRLLNHQQRLRVTVLTYSHEANGTNSIRQKQLLADFKYYLSRIHKSKALNHEESENNKLQCVPKGKTIGREKHREKGKGERERKGGGKNRSTVLERLRTRKSTFLSFKVKHLAYMS